MLRPLPPRPAFLRRAARPLGWIAGCGALALCVSACGGSSPARRTRLERSPGDATPVAEADFSGHLPVDAPLTATFRPDGLIAFFDAIAARHLALATSFHRSDAGFLRSRAFFEALGLEPGRPAWVSVRSGPERRVLQMADDLARVLQAPDQYARWVAENPLPGAWRHARLVGHRRPAPDGAFEVWLGERVGAVQVLGPADAPEMWAAALDASPGQVAAVLAGLAPLGAYRAVLLLEAERPAAVVLSGDATHVVADWVQDAGFGAGGLIDGLAGLSGAEAEPALTGERVSGAPARGELLRVHVAHGPWIRFTRAAAEIEVVAAALAATSLPLEVRGAQFAGARRAAALPDLLLGPGALLFRASRLSVVHTETALTLTVSAPYTARGAKLGTLGDGATPVTPRAIAGAGAAAVSIAPGPQHGRVLDEVAPAPTLPLDRFLADTLTCGLVCFPALWSALPAYGRRPVESLAAVFPEIRPFGEPLASAGGVAFVVESQPRPAIALAAAYGRSLAEPQARWRAALPTFEQRAVATGGDGALVVGNAPHLVDRLARGIGGAPTPMEALVDGTFAGPLGPLFGAFDLRVTLGRDALEVQSRLAWLPLAPPPEAP